MDAGDLHDYLGAPRFYPEQARKELPAGVATGMAWTEMGGEVLFIEATLLPGGQRANYYRTTRRGDAGIGARGPVVSLVTRK